MRRRQKDAGQLTLFDTPEEKIIRQEYSDIMKQSYIDYAMSVIVARAVPDIRDGLKPVQRRILYDMGAELGLDYQKPYRKSARIVGDTMGKFHPHGDSSIYEAMVVMSQDFKREVPLVDGHGNFGSIEGDGAAAQRYTEARLQKITQECYLADLDKDVVDYIPNYDETGKEPEVLPVKVPNFLINGSEGIAVGMATSSPSHNLIEVLDAEIYLLDHQDATVEDLMGYIQGPDFPTGGIVANANDLPDIYKTGTGRIRIQGKIVHERDKQGNRLVITEIPYTMIGSGIATFLNDVALLVDSKQLPDILDISNQSSKEGIKIVLELRKSVTTEDAEKIKAVLLAKTKLEDTFGVNMLAIAGGRPEVVNLRSALDYHIQFLMETNTRKYTTLLRKEKIRAEIQEGLIKAIGVLDAVIDTIRGSATKSEAKLCLMTGNVENITYRIPENKTVAKLFDFTEAQAEAILDMRLSRLIGLELEALKQENEKTKHNMETYSQLLQDTGHMKEQIKKDLKAIQKEYGASRKTEILNIEKAVIKKEEPKAFPEVVLMDKFGYIRAVSDGTYEKNKETADSESKWVVRAWSNDRILFATEGGMLHTVPVNKIPFGKLRDKSIPVDNISTLDTSIDVVLYASSMNGITDGLHNYIMVTNLGNVKSLPAEECMVKSKSTRFVKLKDGERCVKFQPSTPALELVLVSESGRFLRFAASDIPAKKRAAGTVSGMALKDGEEISDIFFLANQEGSQSDQNTQERPFPDLALAPSESQADITEAAVNASPLLTLKNGKQIPEEKIAKGKRGGKGTLKKI